MEAIGSQPGDKTYRNQLPGAGMGRERMEERVGGSWKRISRACKLGRGQQVQVTPAQTKRDCSKAQKC